jgi:hypothetical protein
MGQRKSILMQPLTAYSISQVLGLTSGGLRLWGERTKGHFMRYMI